MPEQLIDTRFPGQQFPVGSVVTFLDRHRRAVFGTVTELRRHEAIVAGGEAGRWRVQYAGLKLIKAGPTGGATMQQVEDHAAQLLERHLNTGAPATWWRFRLETGQRPGLPRLQAIELYPDFTRDRVQRLAAQQPQNHVPFPACAPPLAGCQGPRPNRRAAPSAPFTLFD